MKRDPLNTIEVIEYLKRTKEDTTIEEHRMALDAAIHSFERRNIKTEEEIKARLAAKKVAQKAALENMLVWSLTDLGHEIKELEWVLEQIPDSIHNDETCINPHIDKVCDADCQEYKDCKARGN